jgi:hypothetical protein
MRLTIGNRVSPANVTVSPKTDFPEREEGVDDDFIHDSVINIIIKEFLEREVSNGSGEEPNRGKESVSVMSVW